MENESKYPIGGYAPGNYMCNCTTCKTQFQGDKRAVQCEPCAVKMVKEQVQTLIENNREIAEKEEQKQYLIDIMKADGELGLYEKCDFVDIVNENFWDLIDKPVKEGYEEKLTPKERAKNYMRLKKGYKENEIDTNTTTKNK